MSELKCPFCQQELHKDSDGYYTCYTDNCGCMKYGGNGASGSESLWLALIRTKELLDIECAEHEMCHTQMLKTTEKLERTHKALEIAKDTFNWIDETYQTGQEMEADIWGKVQLAAQEITLRTMTEQEYKKAIQSLEKALGKSKPEDISYLWIAGIGQILPPKHKI